jgi:hypothetical protein
MRRLLLTLPIALIAPAAARPDEAADLKDRVVKAAAKDPADLKKFAVHTLRAKGVSKLAPEPLAATFELIAVYPGQMKATWEFGAGPMKNFVTLCGTDDRGWRRGSAFPTMDLTLEEVNDFRADAYAIWAATLLTLDDRDTKLSAAGKGTVGPTPVVGLKLARRPWPEITLWFDEKTGLLRKMAYKSREAGATLGKEMIYDGHKETSGLMVPTKQTTVVQGRDVYQWTDMEYTFSGKIDPKVFAKP